jgi:hypothetical protein
MVQVGAPTKISKPCRSCGKLLLWGEIRGGRWLALEPEPTPLGEFTFLPWKDRACVLPVGRVPRFKELPPRTRLQIAEGMQNFWQATLDGPRFRRHSKECAIEVAQSVGYVARHLNDDLGSSGLVPHIVEGDVPFSD